MAEKFMTVPRSKLGRKIGTSTEEDMEQVEQALL